MKIKSTLLTALAIASATSAFVIPSPKIRNPAGLRLAKNNNNNNDDDRDLFEGLNPDDTLKNTALPEPLKNRMNDVWQDIVLDAIDDQEDLLKALKTQYNTFKNPEKSQEKSGFYAIKSDLIENAQRAIILQYMQENKVRNRPLSDKDQFITQFTKDVESPFNNVFCDLAALHNKSDLFQKIVKGMHLNIKDKASEPYLKDVVKRLIERVKFDPTSIEQKEFPDSFAENTPIQEGFVVTANIQESKVYFLMQPTDKGLKLINVSDNKMQLGFYW